MNTKAKQQGILILAVSMIILLIMGIFALTLEVRSLNLIKVAAQNMRGEQATIAAEAGLNYGVAYVIHTPTIGSISVATINGQLGSDVGQVVSITSTEESTDVYKIVAVGESDDGDFTKTIEHIIHVTTGDPDSSGYDASGWKDY